MSELPIVNKQSYKKHYQRIFDYCTRRPEIKLPDKLIKQRIKIRSNILGNIILPEWWYGNEFSDKTLKGNKNVS